MEKRVGFPGGWACKGTLRQGEYDPYLAVLCTRRAGGSASFDMGS